MRIKDSKVAEVELTADEWDRLTLQDSASQWDTLHAWASLQSQDSPDLVFYVGEPSPVLVDILPSDLYALVLEAKAQGYEYLKFF